MPMPAHTARHAAGSQQDAGFCPPYTGRHRQPPEAQFIPVKTGA